MREIKFRAWHKKTNLMLLVECIDFFLGAVQLRISNPQTRQELTSAVELMQFTGLKDKNGMEIWEGDVVEYFSGVFYVVWKDCGFRFESKKIGFKANGTESLELSKYLSDNTEVIGNIYSNPELIK